LVRVRSTAGAVVHGSSGHHFVVGNIARRLPEGSPGVRPVAPAIEAFCRQQLAEGPSDAA
jgi:hypothetical protein